MWRRGGDNRGEQSRRKHRERAQKASRRKLSRGSSRLFDPDLGTVAPTAVCPSVEFLAAALPTRAGDAGRISFRGHSRAAAVVEVSRVAVT